MSVSTVRHWSNSETIHDDSHTRENLLATLVLAQEHYKLQPVAVMKPVNPLPVQVGQRLPVLRPWPVSRSRTAPSVRPMPPAHRQPFHPRPGAMTGSRASRLASSYPASRPNTDCRNNPSRRWIVFLLRRVSRSAVAAKSDSSRASSSSRITRRPPAELSCAPRNAKCARPLRSTRSARSEPSPSGCSSVCQPEAIQHYDLYRN